jgi:hypothetical protein
MVLYLQCGAGPLLARDDDLRTDAHALEQIFDVVRARLLELARRICQREPLSCGSEPIRVAVPAIAERAERPLDAGIITEPAQSARRTIGTKGTIGHPRGLMAIPLS